MKYTHFKIIVIALVILTGSNLLNAQVVDTVKTKTKDNILKINIPALFLKNISLQYERKVSRKNSFAIAVRYRPKSAMPFQSTVEKLIDQPSVRVDLFEMGNLSITPEYRFYLGKKGAMQGFYIGPFISYNHYGLDVPVNYMGDTKTGVFTGGMNTFTAGFQLGAQWKLSEKIFLDWWIVGPNYGKTTGDFVCNTPLNEVEQISMDFELFRIMEGTNPKIIESYKVTADGASFKVNGPWGGIRAMGINIGYRF
jgi:hypothetical protein